MGVVVAVRDETSSGEMVGERVLTLASARLTVAELIRERVFQEVAEYNRSQPKYFHSLVQPGDAERTLNGYRMRKARRIDPDEQLAAALEAFRSNRIILLVGDRQVEDLDELIVLSSDTSVSFLKLVPLVGG